jgi:hypothetical protein
MSNQAVIFDPATVYGAFGKLSEVAKVTINDWKASNDTQRRFLAQAKGKISEALKAPNLKLEAGSNDKRLNDFLQKNGIDGEFKPFGPREIGAAAACKLRKEWNECGDASEFKDYHGNDCPAFKLAVNRYSAVLAKVPGFKQPVVGIMVKGGGCVYVMNYADRPEEMELAEMAERIRDHSTPVVMPYEQVRVPMVSLNAKSTLPGMVGMQAGSLTITQAFAQQIIGMNERGYTSTAGAGMSGSRSPSKPRILDFNEAPIVTFYRPTEAAIPMSAAWVPSNFWVRPSDELFK